ncbi:hypothetical protein AB4305_09260 [Nocardia sp. 2YAB30]|uniref:hypothetical protein n=1 Tax=unclassified Nocardia TaxID=2637762 RepID=UPI003F9DDB1B
MQVAVVAFDGFNELDSTIASGLINHARTQGVTAHVTTPAPVVPSINVVEVTGQRSLDCVADAAGLSAVRLAAAPEDQRDGLVLGFVRGIAAAAPIYPSATAIGPETPSRNWDSIHSAVRIHSIPAEALADRESAARGDRVAVEKASNADESFAPLSTSKFERSKE